MILSHRHRFVFIKGIKVAGTSVEIALSQACGPDDIITPITPRDERYRLGTPGEPRNYAWLRWSERRYLAKVRTANAQHLAGLRTPRPRFYNHMALAEVLRRVPAARNYQLIFVERSPYAKVLSFANWQKYLPSYNRGEPIGQSADGAAEAVDRVIADGTVLNVRNIDRYRDPEGQIGAKPWKVDELEDRLGEFFRDRGVAPVSLVHAKSGLQSDSVDVSTVLRPDQIAFIDDAFAEEFETFGFPKL